jgi:molybdopterin adenylyltransferase
MKGPEVCRFGVLTASDRATKGEYEDKSGPEIEDFLKQVLTSPWKIYRILTADNRDDIANGIIDLIDNKMCSVVITTGGTGPAIRDVTPEATESVCERMLPGFGEEMRRISLEYVPTAILSRQTAGIRGESLVINLPGSPRSIREILDKIFASVPYCVDLIGGPYIETDPKSIKSFRPGHK